MTMVKRAGYDNINDARIIDRIQVLDTTSFGYILEIKHRPRSVSLELFVNILVNFAGFTKSRRLNCVNDSL